MICRLSANVTVGVGVWPELIDWLTSLGELTRRSSPLTAWGRAAASLGVCPLDCPEGPGLIASLSGVAPFSLVDGLRFCCFSNVTLRTPIYLFEFERTSLANDYVSTSYCGQAPCRWSCWHSASRSVSTTGSSKAHIPWHEF
jgi:hypothetical protein